MNTLKTAVVVIVLLAVLYGVYRVLNMPDPQALHSDLFGLPPTAQEPGSGVPVSLGQPAPAPGQPTMAIPPTAQLPAGQPATAAQPAGTSPPAVTAQPLVSGQPLGSSSTSSPAATAGGATGPIQQPPSVPAEEVSLGASSITPQSPLTTETAGSGTRRAEAAEGTAGQPEPRTPPLEPLRQEPDRQASARAFQRAWQQARSQIDEGRFRDALATLSVYYDQPGLTDQQEQQLLQWLDALAAKVIYSTEHRLEAPFIVRPGDMLDQIGRQYGVPGQLIFNINRAVIRDPQALQPGTELKVVRGPFRAHISLSKQRLTLFLGELYAGRFPITIGNDPEPLPGVYTVKAKQQWHPYQTRNGQTIPAGHPANPYGQWWIDLGSEMCIHGKPDLTDSPQSSGCISLDPTDAGDLYAILSEGSRVEIRR